MLVLTISPDDAPIHVRVPGRPDILVYLTAIRGGSKVRLGFEAERDINIVRGAALARGGHDGDHGGDGNHGGKGHRGVDNG